MTVRRKPATVTRGRKVYRHRGGEVYRSDDGFDLPLEIIKHILLHGHHSECTVSAESTSSHHVSQDHTPAPVSNGGDVGFGGGGDGGGGGE